MGNRYSDNQAFFAELRSLIDTWCDRRCLRPLGIVLPAYHSFNCMTVGWGELLKALRALAFARDELLPNEQEIVTSLRRAAEDAVAAR